MFDDDGFVHLAISVDVYDGIKRFWWGTVADEDESWTTYDDIFRTLLLNFDEEKLKENGRWKHNFKHWGE